MRFKQEPELLDFIDEVEEERINRKIKKGAFSIKALGSRTDYYQVVRGRSISVKLMKKLAEALDMRLVICLMDKD